MPTWHIASQVLLSSRYGSVWKEGGQPSGATSDWARLWVATRGMSSIVPLYLYILI